MPGQTVLSRIRCEVCGKRVDPWADQRYSRVPPTAPEVVKPGLEVCSACRRRGCPSCLRVVEERADDFFLEVFVCRDCLRRERASGR